MTKSDITDDVLDALFDAVKQTEDPDPEFLARMVAEAQDAVLPRAEAMPIERGWISELGGWFGVGGLALATCAGLWIGFNPPAYLPDPAMMLPGGESAALEDFLLAPFDALDAEEI